jgi:hypothetical protein
VEDRHLDKFDYQKYQIQIIATNWDPKIIGDMVKGIINGNHQEIFNEKGRKYFLLTKK